MVEWFDRDIFPTQVRLVLIIIGEKTIYMIFESHMIFDYVPTDAFCLNFLFVVQNVSVWLRSKDDRLSNWLFLCLIGKQPWYLFSISGGDLYVSLKYPSISVSLRYPSNLNKSRQSQYNISVNLNIYIYIYILSMFVIEKNVTIIIIYLHLYTWGWFCL